jgi:hypothetical protein
MEKGRAAGTIDSHGESNASNAGSNEIINGRALARNLKFDAQIG